MFVQRSVAILLVLSLVCGSVWADNDPELSPEAAAAAANAANAQNAESTSATALAPPLDTCSELGKIINYYTVDAHARGEQVPQVTPEEIFFVSSTLQAYRHHESKRPNFLVFGCGFDSPMWVRLNCGGRTAFIENSAEWVEIVVSKNPELETHVVTYTTKLSERAQYFANPVPMDMPAAVADECWDIALVDAPAGYDGSTPGRMQPVHFAISNIKRCFEQRPEMKHAFVYMHDAQRRGEEDIEHHMLFPNAQHLGLVNNMIGFRFTRETLKME